MLCSVFTVLHAALDDRRLEVVVLPQVIERVPEYLAHWLILSQNRAKRKTYICEIADMKYKFCFSFENKPVKNITLKFVFRLI